MQYHSNVPWHVYENPKFLRFPHQGSAQLRLLSILLSYRRPATLLLPPLGVVSCQ